MPVSFLTPAQRENYGRYAAPPTQDELTRYCHLNDDDLTQIMSCRGEHNRLGFALQLTTVRYLGTFLDDPAAVPSSVLETLSRQLGVTTGDGLQTYWSSKQRWEHITKIREHYGYSDLTEPRVGFRLTRWLYGLCWTGTERPSKLFERATAWLLAHKILLPGSSTLERFVVRLRSRVETRLWRLLGRGITAEQRKRLEQLLIVPEGSRGSWLDELRSGPTRVSGPAFTGGAQTRALRSEPGRQARGGGLRLAARQPSRSQAGQRCTPGGDHNRLAAPRLPKRPHSRSPCLHLLRARSTAHRFAPARCVRQAQLALCRPARKLVRRIGMGSHAAHRMPYSRALGPA